MVSQQLSTCQSRLGAVLFLRMSGNDIPFPGVSQHPSLGLPANDTTPQSGPRTSRFLPSPLRHVNVECMRFPLVGSTVLNLTRQILSIAQSGSPRAAQPPSAPSPCPGDRCCGSCPHREGSAGKHALPRSPSSTNRVHAPPGDAASAGRFRSMSSRSSHSTALDLTI